MNKKFSTLMAGFLLTSAFSSAQISLSVDQLKKVEDDKTIQAGGTFFIILKSATPFPKCYLHKEKWTFDS